MRYNTILWDWNGTLLDDVGVALHSVNQILSDRNMPPISLETYYTYLDTPIRRFYEHLFDLDVVPIEQLAAEFNRNYDLFQNELVIQPAVRKKLQFFSDAKCNQVIVSAAQTASIQYYARQFGVDRYFTDILGAEDQLAESKVRRAKLFMEEKDFDPSKTLMVGDTTHDYVVARELGADCVLVASGHQAERDLLRCGVPVYKTVSEIPVK